MMLSLLAALANANAISPADLLDQAFHGRAGSRWSGVVVVERPGRVGPDTATACREGTSERLDFRDGSLWMAGDTSVFLRTMDRTAVIHPRRHHPPLSGKGDVKIVEHTKFLGRSVVVIELIGPSGQGRRVWVDTSLPAVLKGEPIGNGEHRGPERRFLSIHPGVGCSPAAFQIPTGWAVRQGALPPEGGDARHHGRRHESASLAEVVAQVGFQPPQPPWLPGGFSPRSWAWVETREGRAAQILYSNGTNSISVFWRPAEGPPSFCPSDGCRDHRGEPVFFGQVGKLGLAVTGDISPMDLERVAGLRR